MHHVVHTQEHGEEAQHDGDSDNDPHHLTADSEVCLREDCVQRQHHGDTRCESGRDDARHSIIKGRNISERECLRDGEDAKEDEVERDRAAD